MEERGMATTIESTTIEGGITVEGGMTTTVETATATTGMNTMVETGITTTVIESGQSEEMKTKIRAALRQFLKDRTQLLN